ncbi:MAG TPA: citrate synthase [Thermoanaerobaculia bacterium]|jgi:citrate synthase|nr:citrate synthase [Thermoanaerobaculia bacterium]HEV8611374.1 citrate synthase [Thermoanaerobaculia bacterium]
MVEVKGFKEGLENVVAADSSICYIDGERGILSYRGIDIHDLADNSSFEEVSFLLWEGRLPGRDELEEMRRTIGAERSLPPEMLDLLSSIVPHLTPMDALRTMVSALAETDPDVRDMSRSANMRKAIRLTGQLATIVAAYHRLREGQPVVDSNPTTGHAEDFLRMLNGAKPSAEASRTFDVALILHADHELNASTFSARVTAATLSDMHSAITSAIGTLKGPLHGGANEAVMKMLLEIGSLDRVDDAIHEKLARKEKIMGFGHRVYRTEDPRATHLRKMSKALAESSGETRWYDMSRRIEKILNEEKKLNSNVDFYSASAYYVLGIPIDLYTPIFAVSRVSGWTAHVLEQYEHNRLIRPRAEYTGPEYPQPYVPIEKR